MEINVLKTEVKHLQTANWSNKNDIKRIYRQMKDKAISSSSTTEPNDKKLENQYLMLMNQITFQKWYIRITFIIKPDFIIKDAIALVDSGTDMNCIHEGLIPT